MCVGVGVGPFQVCNATASYLELRYRSSPFAHPVIGDALPTSNLLVRVTRRRKKGRNGGPPGPWEQPAASAEILGEVVRTVRFRQMADFQYEPEEGWNTVQLRRALALPTLDPDAIFRLLGTTDDVDIPTSLRNIPPPIFSRIDVPQSYGFRQNPAVVKIADPAATATGGYKLVNRSKAARLVAHFFDPLSPNNVPSEPPAQALIDSSTLDPEHIAAIRSLFASRPIWPRLGILSSLPAPARKHIKKLLPLTSYFVPSGPFRESWVRYGFDFRRNPESRIYQTVDIRFVKEIKPLSRAKRLLEGKTVSVLQEPSSGAAVAGGLAGGEQRDRERDPEPHIFDGVRQKEMTVYQLADLRSPALKALVESTATSTDGDGVRQSYDDKDGWLTKPKLDAIREELRVEYLRLANRTDERPRKVAAAAEGEQQQPRRRKKKVGGEEEGGESEGDEERPKQRRRGRKNKGEEEGGGGADKPSRVDPRPRARARGVKPKVVRDSRRELNDKVAQLMAGLKVGLVAGQRGGSSAPSDSEREEEEGEEEERGSGSGSDGEEGEEFGSGSGSDGEPEADDEGEAEEGPVEMDEEEEDFYGDIFG